MEGRCTLGKAGGARRAGSVSHKDAGASVMSFDKDRAEVRWLNRMLRGRCLPAAYASRKPGPPQTGLLYLSQCEIKVSPSRLI